MSHVQSLSVDSLNKKQPFADADVLKRQYGLFSDAFSDRKILDVLPGMVLVLNGNRQIIFANRAFCELSGYQRSEDLIGLLAGDVLACHIASNAESGCGTSEACETCGALTAMLSGASGKNDVQECVITRPDGAPRQNLTLRVWSSPLQYAEEVFTVLAGVDISHERRRLALERTFFHDIMNLMGSIRGFAELMEIDDGIDPLEVSRKIQLASQRVIDEIDTQRVLLAVEKGELEVNKTMLDCGVVLKDVIDLYEGQDLARERQLGIAESSTSRSFISDATLIRRILGNMVKNALEATDKGGQVTLGSEVDIDRVSFWVHNAALIPEEYQQRIFQRDFSTKGQGRGLGTYSMKLLGRFINGDVSFTSSGDKGTRFVLTVPLK